MYWLCGGFLFVFGFLSVRRPPRSTRTDTLLPYTTLFRSRMAGIKSIVLRRLRLPLIRPYRLAYRTFEEFEPYMVEVEDEEGRKGFADAHISPGSSSETRDGGWQFCLRSEEHTSELQSLMRISYAVFCLKKKNKKIA